MWWIYALLSAFFAALTAICAKVGVKNIDSDLATAIRTSIILILVWSIILVKRKPIIFSNLSFTTFFFLILSGVATGLSWLFYFKALQIADVSKVAPIDKLSVALAIVLGVIFLGESLTIQTVLGCMLIIGGTILIIMQ